MPEPSAGTVPVRSARWMRASTTALLPFLFLMPLLACEDGVVTPGSQIRLQLSPDLAAVPHFAQEGSEVIDSTFLVLRSDASGRSYTAGAYWPPSEPQIELEVMVELTHSEEPFDFRLELWAGPDLVLESEGRFNVTRDGAPGASEAVTSNFQPAGERARAETIVVSGPTEAVRSGDTLRLSATVFDADGAALSEVPVTWGSLSPEIAEVGADGLVEAGRVPWGSAPIRAFVPYTTVADTVEVTVMAAGIAVLPAADTAFSVGDTLSFTATGLDLAGAPMDGVAPVTWGLADPGVAEIVDTDGSTVRVHTLAEGATRVFASFDPDPALTDTAEVVVAPRVANVAVTPQDAHFTAFGDTLRFTATASDARGNVVEGRQATWTSTNSEVLEVSGDGLATARADGSASVIGSIDGVADTALVTVERVLMTVTVQADVGARGAAADLSVEGDGIQDPIQVAMTVADGAAEAMVDVPAGADRVFTVHAIDADEFVYARGSTTTSIDADVTVDVALEAVTEQVTVRAEVPDHAAAASVEATGFAIDTTRAEMTIDGSVAEVILDMPVGSARTFEVTAFDGNGIAIRRGSATAAVVEGEPSEVNVTLSALEGSQPIVGTFGSFTLILSPGESTAWTGDAIQFTATVLDQDGEEVEDAAVTWASSNPAIAQVDGNGLATAHAAGTSWIAISYQGFAISALLTVESAASVTR